MDRHCYRCYYFFMFLRFYRLHRLSVLGLTGVYRILLFHIDWDRIFYRTKRSCLFAIIMLLWKKTIRSSILPKKDASVPIAVFRKKNAGAGQKRSRKLFSMTVRLEFGKKKREETEKKSPQFKGSLFPNKPFNRLLPISKRNWEPEERLKTTSLKSKGIGWSL